MMTLLGISQFPARAVAVGVTAWALRAAWKKAVLAPNEVRALYGVGVTWLIAHWSLDAFAHGADYWHWNATGLTLFHAQVDMELVGAALFGMTYAIVHRRSTAWFKDARGPIVMLLGAVTIGSVLYWFMERKAGMLSYAPRPGFWPGTLFTWVVFQVATSALFSALTKFYKEPPRVFLPGGN